MAGTALPQFHCANIMAKWLQGLQNGKLTKWQQWWQTNKKK
jgi:hypothetical protein